MTPRAVKRSAFYWPRRVITVFTITVTCPLAKPYKSMPNHPNIFYGPFNDIVATPSLLSGLFRWCLHTKILYALLFQTPRMPRPSQSSWFITRIIFGDKYKSESSSQCNFLPSSIASSALNTNIFLSTLLSNTVSVWPSLNTRYQFSPHRKTGKIIAVFLTFIFRYQKGRSTNDSEANGSKHSPNSSCSPFLHALYFATLASFPSTATLSCLQLPGILTLHNASPYVMCISYILFEICKRT